MNEQDLNLTAEQRQMEMDWIDGAEAEAAFDLWNRCGGDADEFNRLWQEDCGVSRADSAYEKG